MAGGGAETDKRFDQRHSPLSRHTLDYPRGFARLRRDALGRWRSASSPTVMHSPLYLLFFFSILFRRLFQSSSPSNPSTKWYHWFIDIDLSVDFSPFCWRNHFVILEMTEKLRIIRFPFVSVHDATVYSWSYSETRQLRIIIFLCVEHFKSRSSLTTTERFNIARLIELSFAVLQRKMNNVEIENCCLLVCLSSNCNNALRVLSVL